MQALYDLTKGYKTYAGIIIAFVVGGLVYTHVINEQIGKQLLELSTLLIAFGVGDKAAQRYG